MTAKQAPRTPRLISLDVFRGLTIALMIIVNSPGNQSPYHWLEHSVWNGCTLADLVFPFFIVIVGISSVLALSNLRAKGVATPRLIETIMRRSAYIFFMGLLLNAFPHHFDIFSIRILGVLQRIAICYLVSSLLFVTTQARTQAIIMFALLIGYGCLMALNPAMMLDGNAVGYLDRLVLGSGHLYTPMFDPEGLLSTIPAIASALLGNLIGIFLRFGPESEVITGPNLISSRSKQQKLLWMIGVGLLLALSGWIWAETLPLNKSLWSSSYVLWTGGLALLVYAPIYALIEIKQWVRWSTPFDLFGRYAMLVYMLHVLFLKLQAMIHMYTAYGTIVSFPIYITDVLFGHFIPENAALCYSLAYMTLWMLMPLFLNPLIEQITAFETGLCYHDRH